MTQLQTEQPKNDTPKAPPTELSRREIQLMEERKAISVGSTGTTLRTWNDVLMAAKTLYLSGLAPSGLNDNVEKCAIAIQYALELGLPWFTGIQQIAVINGRASLWGDSVLALCRCSPLFDEEAFEELLGKDESTCTVRRKVDGARPVTRSFSMQDARQAGLVPAKEKSAWNTYPKRMLQMRARMWALRDAFPDLLRGMRSVEEAMDQPPDKQIVVDASQVRRLPGETRSDELAREMEAKRQAAEDQHNAPQTAQQVATEAKEQQSVIGSPVVADTSRESLKQALDTTASVIAPASPEPEPKKRTPRKPPTPKTETAPTETQPTPEPAKEPEKPAEVAWSEAGAYMRDMIAKSDETRLRSISLNNLPAALRAGTVKQAEFDRLKQMADARLAAFAKPAEPANREPGDEEAGSGQLFKG